MSSTFFLLVIMVPYTTKHAKSAPKGIIFAGVPNAA